MNVHANETIRALSKLEHEQATEASFVEARRRSSDGRVWWVQAAWQGAGIRRRCWRWDGWILGSKAISIVWISGRGYCVRDLIQSCQVGAFETLAAAQEEAAVAVTELPFAICDLVEEIARFMTAWRAVHEPIAAAVAGGIVCLGRWVMAIRAAESRNVIELARPQIETFNRTFSATARRRAIAA